MKKLLPLGAVVAIAIALWLILMGGQKAQNLPADGWRTYATSTFTISYPPGYSVDDRYIYDIAPGRRSTGVRFTIDPKMASGTNLSADSYVSVESIPTLSACLASPYLYGNPPVVAVTEDGKTYSVATTSGAGAGNFYEETVYVRTDSGACPAVRYYIHTTNINNYPEGAVTEFDRAALLEEFDKVRQSLVIKGAPAR